MDDNDKNRLVTRSGVRGNVRYITITDNIPEHWPEIIQIGKACYTWWAFIYHDHDDTDKHLHILLYDEGGTSLNAHCKRFESVIPSNFVEKVWSPRAMARYLVHKDNPEKHQYDVTLIQTNSKDKLMSFFKENNSDCTTEWEDFCLVMRGELDIPTFLDKYRGEFASMPFYHKMNVYSKLWNGYNTKLIKEDYGISRNKGEK